MKDPFERIATGALVVAAVVIATLMLRVFAASGKNPNLDGSLADEDGALG